MNFFHRNKVLGYVDTWQKRQRPGKLPTSSNPHPKIAILQVSLFLAGFNLKTTLHESLAQTVNYTLHTYQSLEINHKMARQCIHSVTRPTQMRQYSIFVHFKMCLSALQQYTKYIKSNCIFRKLRTNELIQTISSSFNNQISRCRKQEVFQYFKKTSLMLKKLATHLTCRNLGNCCEYIPESSHTFLKLAHRLCTGTGTKLSKSMMVNWTTG